MKRKGFWLTLGLALLTAFLPMLLPGGAAAAMDTNGLTAYYKLNGDANDSSGSGNNGSINGNVSFIDDSTFGKCALFNGGYIEVQDAQQLNLNSKFTISFWVLVDPNNPSGGAVTKLDKNGSYKIYDFYINGTANPFLDVTYDNGDTDTLGYLQKYQKLGDAWSNLVATGDGQNLYLYCNGELITSMPYKSSTTGFKASSGDKAKFRIGSGNDINHSNHLYLGKMAEVRIYNTYKTAEDAAALYNEFTQKPTSGGGSSGSSINVTVNGKPLQSDVPAFVNDDGRTMLPVRAIATALGASVQWDSATQTATLTQGGKTVQATIGQPNITVNGEEVEMDTAAMVKDGRTMLPVRAVGEALGANIGWNQQTNTVSITLSTSTSPGSISTNSSAFYPDGTLQHTQ